MRTIGHVLLVALVLALILCADVLGLAAWLIL